MRLHVGIDEGDGPPLVLLHGWPQHSGMWKPVVPALSKRFRCVAPDLRGLGQSPKPRDGYEKPTLAADVLETLDDLGIEKARFMGHDWGAVVTGIIAREHPERVEKAIMWSVPPPWDTKPDPRKLLGIAHVPFLASPAGPQFARVFARQALRRSGVSEEATESYLAAIRTPEGAHASSQYYRTFLLRELAGALTSPTEKPDVPIKVIGGDRDPVCRYAGDMEKVPGANHFIVDTEPDAVIERALAFL